MLISNLSLGESLHPSAVFLSTAFLDVSFSNPTSGWGNSSGAQRLPGKQAPASILVPQSPTHAHLIQNSHNLPVVAIQQDLRGLQMPGVLHGGHAVSQGTEHVLRRKPSGREFTQPNRPSQRHHRADELILHLEAKPQPPQESIYGKVSTGKYLRESIYGNEQ